MEEPPGKKPSARQAILLHLKKSEKGLTVDDLAHLLGITSMAVRRHLGVLESADLISSVVERRPKGRPAHVYGLSESAHDLFPNNYSGMLTVLLDCLEETSGPEAIHSIFSRWKEKLVDFARDRLEGLEFREKVRQLTLILEDEGFMPDYEEEANGRFLLKEHNCPMRKVAARYDEVCHFELEVYRELLGVDVECVQRIVKGSHCCTYAIVAPDESSKPTADPNGQDFEV